MKKITSLLAVVAITLSLSMPKSSHAIAGFATTNLALVMVGMIVTFSGPVVYSSELSLVGVLLLDEKGNIKFNQLPQDTANKLGVSGQAIEEYNSEVDNLNVIAEELETAGSETQAKAVWANYKNDLSSGTIEVLDALRNSK